MLLPAIMLVAAAATVVSTPLPEKRPAHVSPQLEFGGFQPILGARGAGPSSGYSAPPSPAPLYTGPAHSGRGGGVHIGGGGGVHVGGDGGGGHHGGGGGGVQLEFGGSSGGAIHLGGGGGGRGHRSSGGGPTKTIFVNVPPAPHQQQSLPPLSSGPPRKHYKIVFIRAPPPPPQIQPIFPPRTEQNTRIYVLVQKPQPQEQKVINVPHVQHEPEVFFVHYDKPPTAEELQQLSAGNLDGYTVSAQRTREERSEELYDGDDDLTLQLGPATPLSASIPSDTGFGVSRMGAADYVDLVGVGSDSLVTPLPLSGSATGLAQARFTPQATVQLSESGFPGGGIPSSGGVTLSTGVSDGFGVPFATLRSSELQLVGDDFDNDNQFGSSLPDFNPKDLPQAIHTRRQGHAAGVPLPGLA